MLLKRLLHSDCKAMKWSNFFMQLLYATYSLSAFPVHGNFHCFNYHYCYNEHSYMISWTKELYETAIFCLQLWTDYIHRSQIGVSIAAFLETLGTDRKAWIIVTALQTLRQSPKKFLSTCWEFYLCFHIKTSVLSELIFFLFFWMVLSRQAMPMLMKLCTCSPGAFRSSRCVVQFLMFDWPVKSWGEVPYC